MDRHHGLRRRRLRRGAPLLGLALLPLVAACEPTDPAVERISVSDTGGEPNAPSTAPTISDDGRFVAFVSEASNIGFGGDNGVADVFVHDRTTRRTEDVTSGNAPSGYAPYCFGFEGGGPDCTSYPV